MRISGIIVATWAVLTAFNSMPVSAQFNPDISVIPRFLISTDDGSELPAKRSFSTPRFALDEFEIALQGYLNPYARADVYLAKGGGEEEPFEVEEAYASFVRGLPLDLNARLGKYRVEFGKVNMQHPHLWPFVTRPLSTGRFFGDEGLNDLGLSASVLLPTGEVYSRLSLDILDGGPTGTLDPSSGTLVGGIGLSDTSGTEGSYAFAGRLMTFVPVGQNADVELGVSALSGIHDPYNSSRFMYINLDLKYKWKPDLYTSLTVQSELLYNTRQVRAGSYAGGPVVSGRMSSSGFYAYADYQFRKLYSIGSRVDWSQSPYSRDDRASAVSVFIGYYPVDESTAFRLHLQRTTEEEAGVSRTVNFVALQFMFSLGPHKAHPF